MFKTDVGILKDKLYVIAGQCALARCGLTTSSPKYLIVYTKYANLHNKDLGWAGFIYASEPINTTDFVTPDEDNSNLLQPTRERAIVESIIHLDGCDEGLLIEAVYNYIKYFGSRDKLLEVAKVLGLAEEELDYWINEALNDYTGA